jgi:hypothetical protein
MVDTGRTTKQEAESTVKPTPEPGTLEALGYAIRSAPKGGGFLLYRLGEKEEAIDIVRETQKWIEETAHTLGIQPCQALKIALIKAKATPKKTASTSDQKNIRQFEIVTSNVFRLAPDSGVVDGRAYLGLWLPAKVTDDNGIKLQQVFHLLFSDGELVPGDPETLGERGIYLVSNPIYTPLKISVEMALNIADLPRVNPAEVAEKIIELLKKYIEFDDPRYYVLVAVWIIGTYFHKRFACFPYLFINAVKRSGKTKLLTVLSLLTYNSVFSPNMSTASLFRLTQSAGATTLCDETEDLNDPERKGDFRQLFNSGYKRGLVVYRTEKGPNDTYVPTPYDPYSPKGLANINGLEDVLEDRCISIIMKRGRNRTIINRDVPLDDVIWVEMRDALSCLYLQGWAAVEAEYNQNQEVTNVVSVLSDVCVVKKRVQEKNNIYIARIWELWKPILSIGKHILFFSHTPQVNYTNCTNNTNNTELTLFEQLLDVSVDLILEKEGENTTDTGESWLLMGMLKQVVTDKYYKPKELEAAASGFVEVLPQWFNSKWIGKALKRLGFKEKRRCGRGVEYRLTPDTVKDMAERLGVYLPPTEEEAEKAEAEAKATQIPKNAPVVPTSEKSGLEESEVSGYVQKNFELRGRATKDGQPCWDCGSQASQWIVEIFTNNLGEGKRFYCDTCLRKKIIPAYQAQNAKIDIAAPEPTEEAS